MYNKSMKLIKKDGKTYLKKADPEEAGEPVYTPVECIGNLVAYVSSLQFNHWKANTVTNEHKALGDLYSALQGLTDEFAEAYMGKYGVFTMPKGLSLSIIEGPCKKGLELVEELKEETDAECDDLLNIIADMKHALHKAAYLLKEKV